MRRPLRMLGWGKPWDRKRVAKSKPTSAALCAASTLLPQAVASSRESHGHQELSCVNKVWAARRSDSG